MNLSLILHPIDYSAAAKPALARALALANWHDADLHVLHVRSHLLTVPVPANMIESQTLKTSSRALALDSDLYSMVPGRASQAKRVGDLAPW